MFIDTRHFVNKLALFLLPLVKKKKVILEENIF